MSNKKNTVIARIIEYLSRSSRPAPALRSFLQRSRREATPLSDHDQGAPAESHDLKIKPLYESPTLEFVRLLIAAAEIEHALIAQYLYAWFSLKPEFTAIRYGTRSIKQLAEQEMGHLMQINEMLVEAGASPHLVRQQFPFYCAVFPLTFRLRRFDGEALANFVCAEAPRTAAELMSSPNPGDPKLVTRLRRYLDPKRTVLPIRSLYDSVTEVLGKLPKGNYTPQVIDRWAKTIDHIREQGVQDHFNLLRDIFVQEHEAFAVSGKSYPKDIWKRGAVDLISYPVPDGVSLYEIADDQGIDDELLEAAWLFNLYYWLMLGLLTIRLERTFIGGNTVEGILRTCAINVMTGPLACLGQALAKSGQGAPFDLPQGPLLWGPDCRSAVSWLRNLCFEIDTRERAMKLQIDLGNVAGFVATQLADALKAQGKP